MAISGTGTSQESDPVKAAEDAFSQAVAEINEKPSFILVFATIDYEKSNGLKKIIETICELSKNSCPVIGGTTSGFMTNKGVFSQGVAVMAAHFTDAKINAFTASNTKGDPNGVAKKISEKINSTNSDKYKNKILIEFISGPTVPRFPIINRLNFVQSKEAGGVLTKMGIPLTSMLGYGVANDDIILNKIREKCPDYYIIGGAVIDDGKLFSNYQFFNKQNLTNSMVCVSIQTNEDVLADGVIHMEKTQTTFNITKTSANGTVIDEINGEPAFKVFKEKLDLSEHSFRRKNALYRTTLFYPISTSENIESSTAIGAIYGGHILIGHRIIGDKIELLTASGNRILKMSDNLTKILAEKKGFVYISACETSCEAVGAKIYRQKEIIDKLRNGQPYFITYFGGEHYSTPRSQVYVRTHSFNVLAA